MKTRKLVMALVIASLSLSTTAAMARQSVHLDASSLVWVRSVDERFQSFQVGMSHLTGGETWRTYDPAEHEGERETPEEFAEVREPREPTDLTHPRLRTLTAALGPLYIRYGGTTANSVYFQDNDEPRLEKAPEGYLTVLTRDAWKGALDFAEAVDARILTSFTVSPGVRDATGSWTPVNAEGWLRYTDELGGELYAAELYNEPNAPEPDWDAEPHTAGEYARDFAVFSAFMAGASPDTKLAGPGVIELGIPIPVPSLATTSADEYMTSDPQPDLDIVSYHYYGAISERCVPADSPAGITAEKALSDEWLARPDESFQKYGVLRDQHAPDAPIWLTETGAASCGGTRWQPTFLDTFRYLDTQARLARQGLDAIFTHALISGSNGIIDEQSFTPNASYWAALLWRRLMGAEVLNADAHQQSGLQIYAHCHPTKTGGVTVLVLNLDEDILPLEMAAPQERHSLTAPQLDSTMVLLNGTPLALTADDHLPDLAPIISIDDTIELAPHSVNFIVLPNAGNQYCAL